MAATNRLAGETSPYLRQHAANPVDWYPWSNEAFAAARSRDVPILLSIGYSACHWCHVMAHQSFEDEGVASVMNAGFVNIKVDREERPDVDAVYMEAVQALTGSGGWPMTTFLLPDGRPFHGGTYFPRDSFLGLLDQVSELWRTNRGELEEAAERLSEAVRRGTALPGHDWERPDDGAGDRIPDLLTSGADTLLARIDAEWGGLGRAPKFPQPAVIESLLLASCITGRMDYHTSLVTTLDAMASGGIYDHLAGGFARYSTDRTWLVPHFEKMLYDNALLARLYLHAWLATGASRYGQVVEETLDYLISGPMRIPGAGLASAEDADSEGVEGKFYVWDLQELVDVAGPDTAAWYGATAEGNWEGQNILTRPERGVLARPPAVEAGRRSLLARRNGRVRPGLDDKVLTEWNAMAIAALAESGAAMGRPDWVTEGEAIARFLLASLRRADGRWLRSWQGGKARHLAYAADLAWVAEAFTRLGEATGLREWTDAARSAADQLIALFWDPDMSAFATSGLDAETLVARPIDTHDGALPSANSVAATMLLRLGSLTGNRRYSETALNLLDAMAPALARAPYAFGALLGANHLARQGMTEVVITGERSELLNVVRARYRPEVVLAWGEPYESPLWEGRTDASVEGLAFVCHDYTCRAPTSDPDLLDRELA